METTEDIPEEAIQAIIDEDWKTAYLIIHKMALLGNINAEHFMGWFYEQGIEVEQSDKSAFEWWSKSATSGIAESQCAIAHLYEHGRGTKQDYIKAYTWYSRAIMSGDQESQILISNLTNKMNEMQLKQAKEKLNEQT